VLAVIAIAAAMEVASVSASESFKPSCTIPNFIPWQFPEFDINIAWAIGQVAKHWVATQQYL
jgi:hypothetical protein